MTDDPYTVAAHIRTHLRTIRDNYDQALDPGRLTDDSAHRAGPDFGEPVNLHAVDIRRDTITDLVYWVRFIDTELPDGPTLPHRATDIASLTGHVDLWALHLAQKLPDDADNCRRETARHARDLESLSKLWRSRRVQIPGRCPEQILTISREGFEEFEPCTGELWATMREEDEGMLPGRVECSVGAGHQWSPWQWRDLGRRIGTSAV